MKRDNLIMPAYIGAIFLCVGVKLLWDYSMWEIIVAAVTCSSACFSIADYVWFWASDLRSENNLTSDFSKDILYLSKDFQKMCSENLKKYESSTDDRNVRLLTIFRDFSIEMENKQNERVNNVEKTKIKIRHLEIGGSFFTILSFFLFFCLVFFPEISSMIASKLDVLSVCSFAIILLTQYLTAWRKEKYNINARKYEQIYACWESLFKDLQEVASHAD